MLLSYEQLQDLVRSHRFSFDAAAAHLNALVPTGRMTADSVRKAFADGLHFDAPIDNKATLSPSASATSSESHNARINKTFARVAIALQGGDALEDAEDVVGIAVPNDNEDTSPVETVETEEDRVLAEQRQRLLTRFDEGSEDALGESFDEGTSVADDSRSPPQSPTLEQEARARVDRAAESMNGIVDLMMTQLQVGEDDDEAEAEEDGGSVEDFIAKYADN